MEAASSIAPQILAPGRLLPTKGGYRLVLSPVDRGEKTKSGIETGAALRSETARERLKSDFLKLASHELGGPIAVLRGYLDMAANGTLGEVSPMLAAALPILQGKVDQMAALVDEILEAARTTDRKLMLRLDAVDLREVAEECVATAAPLAGASHTISLQLPSEAVTVLGDRVRLATVVDNLLDNAIKFSPDGCQIQVEVSADANTGLVRVSDSGLGIAPEHLRTVFTPFGRLVTPENSHIPGMGLGLHLCRQTARIHHGDIELQSEPGVGTDALFWMPLRLPTRLIARRRSARRSRQVVSPGLETVPLPIAELIPRGHAVDVRSDLADSQSSAAGAN